MAEHLALAIALLIIAGLACRLVQLCRVPGDAARARAMVATTAPAPPPVAAGEAAMIETLCQDLRARTSGMVGLAELLLAAPLAEDQLRQAELIADSGRTTIRLLGDVLDVARIDGGGLQLHPEPTDLRDVLEHHVNLLRTSARARGLALSLMIDDAVPQSVVLDRARLKQVLLNLLSNAIKFTERGTIEVQARLAQTTGGAQLALSVIDPGIGIARERQAEIFQPFFRQPAATAASLQAGSGAGSGTGLGLALSSRLVEAMGGDIALESAPGLGSCFTVRLPLVSAADYAVGEQFPLAGGDAASVIALSGRRVLVVEDHALHRDLLRVLLETLGLVPTLVGSGSAAIDAVARAQLAGQPFAAILLDRQMPQIDGLETIRRLRAAGHDGATLPAIALLAADTPHDIAACRAAGMQGHLTKPIALETLARTLREVLWATGQQEMPDQEEPDTDLLRRLTADPVRLRDLEARYRLRKEALFANLQAALTTPAHRAAEADWTGIAGQLHRLAGVAANFGDARLGDLARRLHTEFRAQASARKRHAALARSWPELQDAR